jgi:ribosome-binding factor A
MDQRRAQRVSEALREELAEIIEYEMTDPRVGPVAVTAVDVSTDLRVAHVKVALNQDPKEQKQALQALDGARHYLRRELAGRLRLFRVPEIVFEVDTGSGAESRVEELLKRVRKARAKSENPPEKTQ